MPQVALLGGGVLAERTEELPRVQVELHVLLEVAAVRGLVLTERTGKRSGPIVNLAGVARHLVLIGCQVATAVTIERLLTCRQEGDS